MTKQELRKKFQQQRSTLPEKERLRNDDLLLIQFQHWQIPFHAGVLLSYWPIGRKAEVNVHLMTDYLQFRVPGLQVAYPVADFDNCSMKIILTNDATDFKINKYGIVEPIQGEELPPTDIDIVFVPLLVFDKNGYRVGYGKGFYDRFLAACAIGIKKIGFSYFPPVPPIPDINQFDVPLTIGVTPDRMYEF
jgi:5-formyltetrahydrofolate cyclo-ligase